ncbi:MAG: hypothetical protein IAF94_09080, partial [Pirellulaceae bacterium]|nr:hypothetical protein [Pirellulaceae bacterium]
SQASNATVEGIATNGTDVWIVDARQDKVFKYTGAASRLSGSQNAASSFNLASGNGSPTDIVTDGASLWVLNENNNDKVFKYTVSGAALGNWTISTAGASAPTGITLDPSSPSHLWIVDSGTDRVYQYNTAVGRTSGSQAASTSFALAAGNTNPQGIADPPVGDSTPAVAAAPVLATLFPRSAWEHTALTLRVSSGLPDAAPAEDGRGASGTCVPTEDRGNEEKHENSTTKTRFSSIHDEALCDVADELDSLSPVSGRRVRVIR